MARALALLLCALAATAAALSSNDGVEKVDQLSVSHVHVMAAVEQVAQELESELTSLMAQAERHHALLVAKKGINIGDCVQTAFDDILIVSARLFDVIDSVRDIANDLLNELSNCKGNIVTSLPCRLNVLKDAITKAGQLRAKGQELLDKIQQTVKDMWSNCMPSKPTTPAPITAAPTTAAPITAAPTTAAPTTAAPTAAPTTAEPTEGPTDEPTEGPTDEPSTDSA